MRRLKKKPIQVYIEPQQDDVLEMLSKKRGISKAAIIRQSLEKFLKGLPLEEDPALGIVGLGRSGKHNLSERHDQYLVQYDSRKKKG